MNNREIDELLYSLKKKLINRFGNNELSNLMTNGLLTNYFSNELSDNLDNDKIIRKIVTDFYAYSLYKIEIGDDIEDLSKNILDELIELEGDDIVDYINDNLQTFSFMIDKYFEYHENSIMYQCMVMANIINKRRFSEFEDLYSEFFYVDFNYEYLVLPKLVNCGLQLRDFYNNDDKRILNYLNNEFESQIDRNYFLNYILSNVYAYLKINGCSNEDESNLVKLTEKLDRRMKCFYEDNNFVINLVRKYFDIYSDIKWFEFKDIRDYFPFEEIELIYKLDESYKHPLDIMKNGASISTILDEVEQFVNSSLEQLFFQEKTDYEIIEWFKRLFNDEIPLVFSGNTIFNNESVNYFKNLTKLYFLSCFYEYCNYDIDNLLLSEKYIFDYIDKGINIKDGISLFNNEEDFYIIIEKVIDYLNSLESVEYLSRKKIVNDGKLNKLLKINPYMLLEYRRNFGVLFPNETSKSTEYGNIILGTLYNIIYMSDDLEDESGIKCQDLSQMFKNDYFEINMDINEIVGFILSNIYENLINKENLSDEESNFVRGMENNNLEIDDIMDDDILFGKLLLYFFNLNGEFFNDDKLINLRRSCNKANKTKVLKKFDPFYEIDEYILK